MDAIVYIAEQNGAFNLSEEDFGQEGYRPDGQESLGFQNEVEFFQESILKMVLVGALVYIGSVVFVLAVTKVNRNGRN